MSTTRPMMRHVSLRETPRRGSVVIATLLFAIVLLSALTLYLRNATQEMLYAERTFALQQAMNLAESGAEEAVCSLHLDDWSAWTEVAGKRYHRTLSIGGSTDLVNVYLDKQKNNDIWLVSASEVDVSNGAVEKQLFIRLKYRSMFANGLTAKNRVLFNGNQAYVDSYNSNNGAYDWSRNRNDNGSIASNSVEVNSIILQNADVLGYVATGGSQPKLGPQGSITGFGTASGVKVDSSRVATDFYSDFPDVDHPDYPSALTSPSGFVMGSSGTKTYYEMEELSISSSNTLYVMGDVSLAVEDWVDIKGNLVILPYSKLTLYVKGDLTAGGNGIVNYTGKPENMLIYGTAKEGESQEIKLHGNAAMSGVVYAPNAELSLRGGGSSGSFFGAAVAKNITINGTYAYHYDEALKDFSPDAQYRMVEWRELSAASDRLPASEPAKMLAYQF